MRIYLDHNAAAPLRPAVRAAMGAFIERGPHANPASIHRAGQQARRELERARARVAALIGAAPRDVIFTSGGTEANNLAIFGTAAAAADRRGIVATAIEHSSVLEPLAELAKRGFDVTRLAPDRDGLIDPELLAARVDDTSALVTLGLVNAEVGAIQTVGAVAAATRRAGALLHLDAAQAAGRIALRVDELGCDLLTLSAHKLGGPPGIGALYIRPGAALVPQLLGGPQEAARRAGTPNLLGAIGFGAAAEEVANRQEEENRRVAELSRQLLEALGRAIPGLSLNGPTERRVANTLNLTFPDVLGETMLMALDLEGIEVSMGSACAAGAVEPSHVLTAMGRGAAAARSSLRISLGWSTTPAEITAAIATIPRVWRRVVAAEPAVVVPPGPVEELR
jgi:cysteine desulfurase